MGFAWKGLLTFALVLLPNILYLFLPPVNKPVNISDVGMFLNILENGSRVALFLLLIFLTSGRKSAFTCPYVLMMVISLGLYYMLWIRYFMGGREYELLGRSFLLAPVPMAIFPVAFLSARSGLITCRRLLRH
jgi:hypothetical protein